MSKSSRSKIKPTSSSLSPTEEQPHHHIKVLENGFYMCLKCNSRPFKTKANISYHDGCVDEGKLFKCEICGTGLRNTSHLKYHVLAAHSNERPFQCSSCSKSFKQKSKLTRHESSVHCGERPFQCQICLERKSTPQGLNIHMAKHTGERPYACNESNCGKRFTTLLNLKKHSRRGHQDLKAKPYSCPECEKSFSTKWSLNVHAKVHTGEKLFSCGICSRRFSMKKDVVRHKLTHSDLKPYKCTICQLEFKRKDNITRHLNTVHGITKEDIAINKHFTKTNEGDEEEDQEEDNFIVSNSGLNSELVTIKVEINEEEEEDVEVEGLELELEEEEVEFNNNNGLELGEIKVEQVLQEEDVEFNT